MHPSNHVLLSSAKPELKTHILGKPRTKGNNLNGAIAFVKTVHPERWEPSIARLSPAAREEITGLVLAGSWYSFDFFREFTTAFCEEIPGGAATVASRWGAFAMDRDMNGGIYRAALKVASPEIMVKAFGRLWGLYNDTGAADVVRQGEGFVTCILHGLYRPSPSIFHATVGASGRLMELAGAKDVRARVLAGAGPNDRYCEWSISWR